MCFNNARDVASLEVLKKTNNKEKGRNLESRWKITLPATYFRVMRIRLVKQDTNAVHARRLIVQRYIGGIIQSIGSIICIRAW